MLPMRWFFADQVIRYVGYPLRRQVLTTKHRSRLMMSAIMQQRFAAKIVANIDYIYRLTEDVIFEAQHQRSWPILECLRKSQVD